MHDTVRFAVSNHASGSVLLVEDDVQLARALSRMLGVEGYNVVSVATTGEAVDCVKSTTFDAVISDLNLGGDSGFDLISVVKAYDPDLPVVIMTGFPTLDSAIEAVGLGVTEYLVKPMSRERLLHVVARAMTARRMSTIRRDSPGEFRLPAPVPTCVSPTVTASFERALSSLEVDLDPVVDAKRRVTVGFEARIGTSEDGLETRLSLVAAAESLGRSEELQRRMRDMAVRAFVGAPMGSVLFYDLDASDLVDADLYSPDAPLSRVATDVVLQIGARSAALAVDDLAARMSVLRFLGFRIAITDLDGHSRVAQVAELSPEFVKIDASLVRSADRDATRTRLVAALSSMSSALGATAIGASVMTAEERDALVTAGCRLVQGPLYARLSPGSQRTHERRARFDERAENVTSAGGEPSGVERSEPASDRAPTEDEMRNAPTVRPPPSAIERAARSDRLAKTTPPVAPDESPRSGQRRAG